MKHVSRLQCRCGAVLDESEGMMLKLPATHNRPDGDRCSLLFYQGDVIEMAVPFAGDYLLHTSGIHRLTAEVLDQ